MSPVARSFHVFAPSKTEPSPTWAAPIAKVADTLIFQDEISPLESSQSACEGFAATLLSQGFDLTACGDSVRIQSDQHESL